jgi:hypothetical protein
MVRLQHKTGKRIRFLVPGQISVLMGVRPIFGGLVEHEKSICLRTPENVVRTLLMVE